MRTETSHTPRNAGRFANRAGMDRRTPSGRRNRTYYAKNDQKKEVYQFVDYEIRRQAIDAENLQPINAVDHHLLIRDEGYQHVSRPERSEAAASPSQGSTATESAPQPARRGPGRPRKDASASTTPRRGPGRPRKDASAPRRGPGRPPKNASARRGPGRPPKLEASRRGPGRPRKDASAPRRGPGRPRKDVTTSTQQRRSSGRNNEMAKMQAQLAAMAETLQKLAQSRPEPAVEAQAPAKQESDRPVAEH